MLELKDSYQYLSRALELGEETGDQRVIGYACAWLTHTCAWLGLLDEAIAYGERAQEISRSLEPDHYLYHKSLGGIGNAYLFKGEVKKAFATGEALLEYGRSHSSIHSQVWGNFIMGFIYLMDGDFSSLIECSKQAAEVAADSMHREGARGFISMGYAMNGQVQEAEDILKQVLTFGQKLDWKYFLTMCKGYMGAISMVKGRMDQGLKMIEEAQQTYLESGAKPYYVQVEYMLGNVYLQMVQRAAPVKLTTVIKNIGFLAKNVPFAAKKAESHFNKVIEVSREIGAKGFLGMAYLDLGALHKAKGEKDRARNCLSTAVELFEQCENENLLRQAREALASL